MELLQPLIQCRLEPTNNIAFYGSAFTNCKRHQLIIQDGDPFTHRLANSILLIGIY
jgi:hypothetical protein